MPVILLLFLSIKPGGRGLHGPECIVGTLNCHQTGLNPEAEASIGSIEDVNAPIGCALESSWPCNEDVSRLSEFPSAPLFGQLVWSIEHSIDDEIKVILHLRWYSLVQNTFRKADALQVIVSMSRHYLGENGGNHGGGLFGCCTASRINTPRPWNIIKSIDDDVSSLTNSSGARNMGTLTLCVDRHAILDMLFQLREIRILLSVIL